MNTLITISEQTIGQETVQTVNARELCAFLEVGKDFSTWITNRINQYEFVENQDFVCSPILGSKGRGGHNRKEYHLTLDMAKELAMVERNEKGREARQYFIECERKAKQPLDLVSALQNPLTIRQLLLPIDNVAEVFIYANQVLQKHFYFTADRLPTQSFFRKLKTLTHCMRVAYSDFVGCSYAIQYPHGESVTTDCEPCF
ncbi:antA/AntB antirepressor family protein [Bartonella schoenbuchensis]|uniref:Anti-repressor protein n=1 Tax=Bartonella schoenbuchensis (strain DSM 13525 / NCTC 13165 / R1) TaxID=687861 RepID=E6YZP7_BARSR|nr:antA/AntB antirepressor family protein [Bartonella schoenbuchensis]AQX30802.1 Phage anti-repressor protein [Bartonella schoenbuchensis R1]CBI82335.1 Anti-repressor protein [Bartonella schoenbuchensis R1]